MVQVPDQPSLSPEQEEKLQELTGQSWNLELVVSGVIMFAVLQVPDLLDVAFGYVHYNLMSRTAGLLGMLPTLALSVMKASCYVLFFAFLTNFVMRAYWVALVGLLAVYPTGIHYDRLPFSTPYAQQRMNDDLGPLDRYILRLDRRCNVVFAVAFIFVFYLIIIGLAYVLILFLYAVLRPLIPAEYWPAIRIATIALFALYMLTSIILSVPSVRTRPNMINFHYQFTATSKVIMWGMHMPLSFITNTFFSHIPQQKILKTFGLMGAVLFVMIMIEFTTDLSRQSQRTSLLNRRHLYSARVDSLFIDAGAYDDQRGEDAYIGVASIQSDVIREPFVRLYIAYPKALDTLLTRLAPEPAWNPDLPVAERRSQFARWSNQQVNQLIRITVNDSLYRRPELLFTQRGAQQQRGWQTVLIPTNLKPGRNTLRICIQSGVATPGVGQSDTGATHTSAKEEELVRIPFWYVPEP